MPVVYIDPIQLGYAMFRQYDYRHYSMTFRMSEVAYDLLLHDAVTLGTIEIHREHVPESDAPTRVVDGEKRDHYGTDHIHQTTGGDVFRRREYHGSDDIERGDDFEMMGSTTKPPRLLPGIYREEWRRQEQDDNQFYWFEWRVGADKEFPENFTDYLPRRISRSCPPPEHEKTR